MIELERAVCPLCRGTARRPVCVKFDLPIVSCRGCGLVMADPRLPESELMKRYEQPGFVADCLDVFRASAEGFDIDRIQRHYYLPLELLGMPPHPGARLLDVGCGPGFFLEAAGVKGWESEGIEASKTLAVYGRDVLGVRIRGETFEAADIPAKTFDAVALLDVLEHIREPGEMLQKAARILRPGGRLIVGTPDYGSLSRRIFGRNWAILSPAEHLFNFTRSTLARILDAAGFEGRAPANFLVFNPEATHAPGTRRHRLWSRLHERLERNSLMQKIQMYEVRRVLRSAGGLDTAVPDKIWKKGLQRLYEALRVLVNGDMLYALAIKK